MSKRAGFGVALCALTLMTWSSVGNQATAHGIFKKTLEKKHTNLRVTCNMCHVKGEAKTERNPFGKMFYEQFKGKDLSARWEAVEGDDRKQFENEVMAPAFLEALKVVNDRETKEGVKYGELIPNGKIDGSKLKKK